MTTIIQIVQHLRPGGIETMALDLLSFGSKSNNCYIVSLEDTFDNAVKRWPRLAPYKNNLFFCNKKPGFQPSLFVSLFRLFQSLNPIAIHTHHIGPLIYAGISGKAFGIPSHVHTEHDTWHLANRKQRELQKYALKISNPKLVADSNSVAKDLAHYIKNRPITVIKNGINTERFIPGNKIISRLLNGLPVDKKIIGCSGRMEIVKGQRFLLDALSLLSNDIHLAIAGSGSQESKLKKQARSLNIENRVHFLGHLDNMSSFYQALDVFCLPSLNEGFPLSPLEAQSCGIRTVVTNVGGSIETICPQTGDAVEKESPIALSLGLLHSLNMPKSPKPREFAIKHGNVTNMIAEYSQLLLSTNVVFR